MSFELTYHINNLWLRYYYKDYPLVKADKCTYNKLYYLYRHMQWMVKFHSEIDVNGIVSTASA